MSRERSPLARRHWWPSWLHQGLAGLVPAVDEASDCGDELPDAGEGPAAGRLAGGFSEEDLRDPRALDRPVTVTDDAPSTTTYSYDPALDPRGLPTSVTDSVAGGVTPHYDAEGEVVAADLPGGVHLTSTDDPAGAEHRRSAARHGWR